MGYIFGFCFGRFEFGGGIRYISNIERVVKEVLKTK